MNQEPINRDRVTRISLEIFAAVQDNYRRGPSSRDRCLEALNALAGCAAVVIAGANDEEALAFFQRALEQNIQNVVAEPAVWRPIRRTSDGNN